jgi:hypothetical protein
VSDSFIFLLAFSILSGVFLSVLALIESRTKGRQMFVKFLCRECGPSDHPCRHYEPRPENPIEFHALVRLLNEVLESQQRLYMEFLRFIRRPQSATLTLVVGKPDPHRTRGAKKMPATIKVGGTASSAFQEFDGPSGTGNPVANAGPANFESDNPAVATVDAASGIATGVGAGTCNIKGTDSVNGLAASDVLTVEAPAPVAQSATLVLTAQ